MKHLPIYGFVQRLGQRREIRCNEGALRLGGHDVVGKVKTRTILRLHPRIAPIKIGVFPLLKNKPELVAKAREVYALLKKHLYCFYDETASIGRRYARQDEVGTPFGVTIDFDSLGEKGPELRDTVTLRHRDSNEQERVKISDLLGKLLPLVS
jgi:glycyl-tRNA synthetase